MNALARPRSLARLLAGYGIHPTKRLGQHFLVASSYLAKLTEIDELPQLSTVLEVGPGPGNLTEPLLDFPADVIAVEIDRRFTRLLNDRFAQNPRFSLQQCDILDRGKIHPAVLAVLEPRWHRPWGIISNLPYQVAATVIIESLHLPVKPSVICVTVQREVARRLRSQPGGKDYGALTVLVQSYRIVELLANVPAGAFWPRPAVQSAIVKLTPKEHPKVLDSRHLRELVDRMFRHRRKRLQAGYVNMLPPEQRSAAIDACRAVGVDLTMRAEQLPVEAFIALSNVLADGGADRGQAGEDLKQ